MSPRARPAGADANDDRLRREDRLRKSREFRAVARQGRRRAGAHFVVVAAPGSRSASASSGRRLGLAVSRRVGGAVVRNAVKRRVREWFRRGGREQLAPGVDVVVIARSGAGELGGRAVAEELDRACRGLCAERGERAR